MFHSENVSKVHAFVNPTSPLLWTYLLGAEVWAKKKCGYAVQNCISALPQLSGGPDSKFSSCFISLVVNFFACHMDVSNLRGELGI
jgi:hypothetical protein